jgi:hypothetical protein
MDLRTAFDDEDFFERYAAEQPALADFDAAEAQSPSAEQLAHLTRFRKPVAWIVAGLTLFSLLALEEHGARRAFLARYGAPRELVAHYGAAIARPTKSVASVAGAGKSPSSTSAPTSSERELLTPPGGNECESAAETANSNLVADFVSLLTSMCLPEAAGQRPSEELERPSEQIDAVAPSLPRVLDLCLAGGQARDSWSLPLSMTWSSPFARP